jgi:hypothetical protein
VPEYSEQRIQRLLDESDNAPTHDEKGDKLEQLIVYLFAAIPGVSFLRKNILDGSRAHEIDVAFWNPQNISPLCFLDATLIVECKNTVNRVGSHEVGWLVRKLQDRGAFSGILIGLSGITGHQDGTSSAHSEVLSALIRDKIKMLVVTRQEIQELENTDQFVELLRGKFLKLTLQKTVSIDEVSS